MPEEKGMKFPAIAVFAATLAATAAPAQHAAVPQDA
jgi:hypothetical protein